MKAYIKQLNLKLALPLFTLCLSMHACCQQNLIVKTSGGYIQGFIENNATVFKGVPYAAPPVGILRFKPTRPHEVWNDTLHCNDFGPVAAQYNASTNSLKGSEDCLRLNIYEPRVNALRKLPVLVWIHGGAMTAGSGIAQNGHAFADRDSIITITINYRLGVFGFLYMGDVDPAYNASGNNGLLDCIMALRWIKENIASFGGDPSKVTVMGESAGAKLASTLLASPQAKGYFKQLILESGSVQCIRDSTTAKFIRKRLLDVLKLTDASLLTNVPAEELIKAQTIVCQGAAGTNYFGPVKDGVVINSDPYLFINTNQNKDVRFLIGTNKEESIMFMGMDRQLFHPAPDVLYAWFGKNYPFVLEAYRSAANTNSSDSTTISILTQYMYQMHSYRLADELAKMGNDVWMYRFDFDKDGSGATHAKELPFVWSLYADSGTEDYQKLAYNMHSAWVRFIKNDQPGTIAGQDWPRYKPNQRNVMLLDTLSKPIVFKSAFNDPHYPTAGFILDQSELNNHTK